MAEASFRPVASPKTDDLQRLSRRDALRRAAMLGGSLAVAGPAVQRLATGVGYATDSPVPPPNGEPTPPPEEPKQHALSYIGLVFTCDTETYRAKWEEGGNNGKWIDVRSLGSQDSLPHCPPPSGWASATGLGPPRFDAPPDKAAIQVSTVRVDGDTVQVTFTLPSSCQFLDGAGVAMGAGGDKTEQGFCIAGSVEGNHVTFTAPVN